MRKLLLPALLMLSINTNIHASCSDIIEDHASFLAKANFEMNSEAQGEVGLGAISTVMPITGAIEASQDSNHNISDTALNAVGFVVGETIGVGLGVVFTGSAIIKGTLASATQLSLSEQSKEFNMIRHLLSEADGIASLHLANDPQLEATATSLAGVYVFNDVAENVRFQAGKSLSNKKIAQKLLELDEKEAFCKQLGTNQISIDTIPTITKILAEQF